MKSLADLDPTWAWDPFVPTPEQPWNRSWAAHLHRRAGFGASTRVLDETLKLAPSDAVQSLMNRSVTTAEQQASDSLARSSIAGGKPEPLSAWWLHQLLTTSDPLREKLTLFWHGHFATGADKVTDPELMYAQNKLFRSQATGNFRELTQSIARDPAMLIYLDSATNRKLHPNENFARELMELFCLGEGNYTERDIRELARCFTGWEIRRGKYRFNKYQNDAGSKTFLGETGQFSGEQGIDIVLKQSSCPRFVTKKLIHYYLFDEPDIPESLVNPLAESFASDWAIAPLVQRILSSNLFFSAYSFGRKVRSPVDFSIGLMHGLEMSTNVIELTQELGNLGQRLFFPPNVKAWDGGRSWINSSTLLGRANLVKRLLNHKKSRFNGGSLSDLLSKHKANSPQLIVSWLVDTLFAVHPPQSVQHDVVALIETPEGDRETRLREAVRLLCTQPEFHLG
ncbi:MAG: DUF1800 domain-containing protein [Planctomycetaceae bacterium]